MLGGMQIDKKLMNLACDELMKYDETMFTATDKGLYAITRVIHATSIDTLLWEL